MRNHRATALSTLVLWSPLSLLLLTRCLSGENAPPAEDAGGYDVSLPPIPESDSGADVTLPAPDATAPDASLSDTSVPDAPAPLPDQAAPPMDAVVDGAPDAVPDVVVVPDAPALPGAIAGRVLDVNQFSIGVVPGATVSVGSGASLLSTTTDANGSFTLAGIDSGARVLVTVSVPSDLSSGIAYSTAQVAVPVVAGETSQVFPEVLEGCIGVTAQSATAGGSVSLADACPGRTGAYASIAFQAGGLVDGTGATFAGNARVEEIPLSFPLVQGLPDFSWARALPGDSSAVRLDHSLVAVQSLGGAEIRVFDDATGSPLAIAPGHPATLSLATYRAPTSGETFASWYYDVATGLWTEDGAGTFSPITVGQSSFEVYQVAVSHLTWWSVDEPQVTGGCARGKLAVAGAPAANVYVSSAGTDFLGAASTVTAADSSFCVNGLAGGHLNVVAVQAIGAGIDSFTGSALAAPLSAAAAQCQTSLALCADLGTIALTESAPVCVSGTTAFAQHREGSTVPITTPIPLYTSVTLTVDQAAVGYVNAIHLGAVVPDVNGTFCTPYTPGLSELAEYDPGCNIVNSTNAIYFAEDAGTPAAQCGGTGCVDTGELFYGCS